MKKILNLILALSLTLGGAPFLAHAEDPAPEPAFIPETKIYYFTEDHLGNIDTVTDEKGDIVERRDYLPYGATRSHIQEAEDFFEVHGFTGKEEDANGLTYFGARYYDPALGRFLTQDPFSLIDFSKMTLAQRNAILSQPEILFPYAYANNNPLRYKDPTGMFNVETGAIESNDTPQIITSGINDKWGTSYSWNQIANLNSGVLGQAADLTQLVGKILTPNLDIPDVTFHLKNEMSQWSFVADLYKNNYALPEKLAWFYEWSLAGNKGDLKNRKGSIFDTRSKDQGGQGTEGYVYNAEKIRYDAPANVLYGYVGRALGFGEEMLSLAAGVHQTLFGPRDLKQGLGAPNYGDNRKDNDYIRKGAKEHDSKKN